ncbi:MAG TPA: aminodeoxychorismate/anthranilate synthase component II [Candidatus Latescibacteria bacterium]|nr:aminodeoxychorismate/anthranilate synthase component II [Candidatus Latescibacterota bacterium]
MVLIIDNYDSFTYNLVQYLGELGAETVVLRNDSITVNDVESLHPERIVLSPGPCTPNEAGICLELVRALAGTLPVLGVCLGHEVIGQAFGGRIVRAPQLMHGKTSEISHDGKGVFRNIPNPFTGTRYHSLVVDPTTLPECLEISAETDGVIMGLRHRQYAIEGVQFHPESILTTQGKAILANFLSLPNR